ncbi:MAG: NAD+ synthase [Actinomycetota bacterium]|nr:NAD+ synthase [Actinomycetota bacterium]
MVRMALAQLNLTVGDVDGNKRRLIESLDAAREAGAQVFVAPELAVSGYPPEDLLLKRSFLDANVAALAEVAAHTGDLLAFVGFAQPTSRALYNAAAICQHGRVLAVYRKHILPNYGVFDEVRYFDEGRGHTLVETPDGVIGVCICEDAWSPRGPVVSQGDAGAQIVVNVNASPWEVHKMGQRTEMLGERARRAKTSIVYVNAVGGQDELVFDGGSLVIDSRGDLVARLPQFEETLAIVDVPLGETRPTRHPSVRRITTELRRPSGDPTTLDRPELSREEAIYTALCLGLRDYVRKNRFSKVVVGLSGGIDSSLVATIAADALGPDAVLGVSMPSEFSSTHSVDDAKELSANLGIQMLEISIRDTYDSYVSALRETFGDAPPGLAEENVQARIRGNLLMAISNRYGHLVIATGNKSEMACGYATLYGDMAGGFALLKDVFKTDVYALARYRNGLGPVVPGNVLTKAPSAELRPDQKDSDFLPPYDVLDPILEAYVEGDAGIEDVVAAGHDRATVERVVALVDRAEYKRRQAPPGPKVTTKAFGRDRRLPITNHWREGAPAALPRKVVGEQGPE